MRFLATTLLCLIAGIGPVMARPHADAVAPAFDRHAVHQHVYLTIGSEALIGERRVHKVRSAGIKQMWRKRYGQGNARAHTSQQRGRSSSHAETQLLPHPSGCPSRAFCGCGAALEVFGRHVRELWLARNWFKFPAAAPAPGMVAVRRHHVFVIREVMGPGLVLAFDANSGGHKTRLHLRSLAGYSVRNPRGSRYATAG